ncbi:unnamed protein product [Trichogramma brassicae]|uniref:Uncharacterized protein n=1 Tax=Trichogramma brassicae TaxID=86971 RepID=A0A6H5HXX3_9HYME|nr:unnamed protein product [Trichogramma brassicae]
MLLYITRITMQTTTTTRAPRDSTTATAAVYYRIPGFGARVSVYATAPPPTNSTRRKKITLIILISIASLFTLSSQANIEQILVVQIVDDHFAAENRQSAVRQYHERLQGPAEEKSWRHYLV